MMLAFFKLNEVYQKMRLNGRLNTFLHEENMKYTEIISDELTYKEAIDVLNQSEKTHFIHIVSMQNHTSYAEKI